MRDDDFYEDDYDDDMFYEIITDLKSMEQINNALTNLINYSARIYELTMEEMYELESFRKQKSSKFESCLKKLKILKIKEQRIIDNIKDEIAYEDFSDYIDKLVDKNILDANQNSAIKQRITYMFEKAAAANNAYFDEEVSREFSREYYYTKDIILTFLMKNKNRINKNSRLLKYKYKQAFINADIETELLYSGYNLDNIVRSKEEDKHNFLGIDKELYTEEKIEFYYDFTMNTIKSLIKQTKNKKVDKDEVYDTLDLIRFLLKKVITEDLPLIYDECANHIENDNTIILYKDISVIDKLLDLCVAESDRRYLTNVDSKENDKQEENISVSKLSEELIDQTFNLIKQVNNTCEIGMKMCILEIHNKQQSDEFNLLLNQLEASTQKENDIINHLEINENEKDVIANIINTSLNLILGIDAYQFSKDLEALCDEDSLSNRNNIIRQRIYNLIPNIYLIDDSVYKNSDVPLFIIQQHLIEVMKEFEKNINEAKEKAPLIVAKYEEILCNNDLTNDFLLANGKIQNLISLDDEVLAKLLEIDIDEYIFDKSELLYNYVTLTIQGLLENPVEDPSPLELARIEFQGLFINIAAESIMDDKVEIVYEDELSEEEIQKIKKL